MDWSTVTDMFDSVGREATNARAWADAKLAEAARSVNETIIRAGLPGGGDDATAKGIENLRALGLSRSTYKLHAKAYIVNVAVPAVIAHQRFNATKDQRFEFGLENAELSGLMLQMYVNEQIDPVLIERMRQTVLKSQTLETLTLFTELDVQETLGKGVGYPSEPEVRAAAQKALQLVRKPSKKDGSGGLSFKFSEEGFKPIIEGVKGLDVVRCTIALPDGTLSPDVAMYSLSIRISDTYKFKNLREPGDYTFFREILANYLISEQYAMFEMLYSRAMIEAPLKARGGAIDKSLVFASYMYAMEMAGYFKPVPWFFEVGTRPMVLRRSKANPFSSQRTP